MNQQQSLLTINDKLSTISQLNQTSSNDEKNNTIENETIPASSVHAAHRCPRGKSFIIGGCRKILEGGNLRDNHI